MQKKIWIIVALVCVGTSGVQLRSEDAMPNQIAPSTETPPANSVKVMLKIGTGIENKEVVGETEPIPATSEQLVAWTLVEGAEPGTTIMHEWVYNGVAVTTVNLEVKSAWYRTYSRIMLNNQPGNWKVEAKDASGTVLASRDFKVE